MVKAPRRDKKRVSGMVHFKVEVVLGRTGGIVDWRSHQEISLSGCRE